MYLQNQAIRNNTNKSSLDKMRSRKNFHANDKRTWKRRNKEEEEDGNRSIIKQFDG